MSEPVKHPVCEVCQGPAVDHVCDTVLEIERGLGIWRVTDEHWYCRAHRRPGKVEETHALR